MKRSLVLAFLGVMLAGCRHVVVEPQEVPVLADREWKINGVPKTAGPVAPVLGPGKVTDGGL